MVLVQASGLFFNVCMYLCVHVCVLHACVIHTCTNHACVLHKCVLPLHDGRLRTNTFKPSENVLE